MTEKDLNHDLVSLFNSCNAMAYKIPDPLKASVMNASKRPFDGFARFPAPVNDFWFESKLIKDKIRAFDVKRVEDHQFAALRQIKRNGGCAAVILGCWIPRQDYWFLVFDVDFLMSLNGGSIKQKDLLWYCKEEYSISLRSRDMTLFRPEWLIDKMITALPGAIDGLLHKQV